MKNFLLGVSVGLIAVHAHGADKRKSQNPPAQRQQRNQGQQSTQENRSNAQRNDNPLAQTQFISRPSWASSPYSAPVSLTASTPLPIIAGQSPTPDKQEFHTLVHPHKEECLTLIHSHFYRGRGYVTIDALSSYTKDENIYMLFCAERNYADWPVGWVACNKKDGAKHLSGSSYNIELMAYAGDLFSGFKTQAEALQYIRASSKKFFDKYFQEIAKCREEVRKEYDQSNKAPTTTIKSKRRVTDTTDNTSHDFS